MYRFHLHAFPSHAPSSGVSSSRTQVADVRSAETSPRTPATAGNGGATDTRNDDRRQLLGSLLADREWKCDPSIRSRLEALQQCLQHPAGGDAPPQCPAEAEWSLLAGEIEHYLDFRRLRHLEAQLHGSADADFHFDHHDWQVAHAAEAALATHLRRVHEESYLPDQPDLYLHVH